MFRRPAAKLQKEASLMNRKLNMPGRNNGVRKRKERVSFFGNFERIEGDDRIEEDSGDSPMLYIHLRRCTTIFTYLEEFCRF